MLKPIQTRVRRADLVDVALGRQSADWVIRGGQLVNVYSGEIYPTDVAIKGERIALVGDASHTLGPQTEVIDAQGLFLCPGLADFCNHAANMSKYQKS